MNTPDDNSQHEPAVSYERARFFIVASWVLRLGWFCTVWTFVWLGWGLFAISTWLDSFVARPRPKFTFGKTEISNWILLFAFAIGVCGMLLFSEFAFLFIAFGLVATVVVLFEAFHYARADVQFLRSLREAQPGDDQPFEGQPDDELPQENRKPHEEQLPLL